MESGGISPLNDHGRFSMSQQAVLKHYIRLVEALLLLCLAEFALVGGAVVNSNPSGRKEASSSDREQKTCEVPRTAEALHTPAAVPSDLCPADQSQTDNALDDDPKQCLHTATGFQLLQHCPDHLADSQPTHSEGLGQFHPLSPPAEPTAEQTIPPEEEQQPQQAATEPQVEEIEDLEEDRHNFASARDGAKLVAANKEAKKAAAVLDSDGDTFCKNECKADKWLILELSQLVKMDALELSQFELYSSRINEFEARGRQNHPRHDGIDYSKSLNSSHWKLLGRFEAANSKGTQAFKLPSPAWIKYLQLRFFSHHGNEPVCALNDVLVYGKSAADDLEDQLAMDTPDPQAAAQSEPSLPPPHSPLPPPPLPQEGPSPPLYPPAATPDSTSSPSTQNHSADGSTTQAGGTPKAGAVPAAPDGDAEAQRPSEAAQQGPASQQAVSTAGSPPGMAPLPGMPPVPLPPVEAVIPPASAAASDVGSSMPAPIMFATEGGALVEGEPALDSEGLLLLPSQGGKGKPGASVYDILVGELRGLKLQQKSLSRSFAALEQNVSAAVEALSHALGTLALDVSMLERTYSGPAVAALEGSQSSSETHGQALSMQLAELQKVQRRTWFRESALLSVVAMCAGAAFAGWLTPRQADGQKLSWGQAMLSRSILLLAIANGLCALLLQLSEGMSLTLLGH